MRLANRAFLSLLTLKSAYAPYALCIWHIPGLSDNDRDVSQLGYPLTFDCFNCSNLTPTLFKRILQDSVSFHHSVGVSVTFVETIV